VLLGGSSPAGAISFQLYAAVDAECRQPLLAQPLSVSVTGDGHYTTPPLPWSQAGEYQWLAGYSGDAHNAPAKDVCDEPSERVIVKARPSIAQSASPSVTAGETIDDSASLAGGSSPTGAIGFELYAAGDTECSRPLLSEPLSVSVAGDGRYTSPPLLQATPGAYQWVATYAGDAHNAPAKSACEEPDARVLVKEPPPQPTILAESASQPTPTGVLLSAAVNPGGQLAAYHFEYGLSPSYGSSTTEAQIAAGQNEVAVGPTAIEGLQPGATYHYRLVLDGAAGTTFGPDETFVTPGLTLVQEAPGPTIEPLITGPPSTTHPPPAFGGLSLHADRDPRRLVVQLTVNVGGSKLALKATAPSSPGRHAKRHATKSMVVASLTRADIAAGPLKLAVPLNARAKLALRNERRLKVTVTITATLPSGKPEVVVGMITLEIGGTKTSA
jgi:hypothetical protein